MGWPHDTAHPTREIITSAIAAGLLVGVALRLLGLL